MIKYFRTYCLLAVVLAMALLPVSCIKEDYPVAAEKASVTMTFTTRVSDNVTAGNLLDNEQMQTLRVIVARSGTKDIIYNVSYDIQPGETQKTIRFSELTVKKEGEKIDFYAIANEQAFLSDGESLENVDLGALKARILKKDFNNPALSLIPQAAFTTIKVGPNEQKKASMKLLFPLVKVVLNFDNQTGEPVGLTNVQIDGTADQGYLFKDVDELLEYPQATTGMGTVEFGTEGALTVPAGEVADVAPFVRYLYPWNHDDGWKLTATWGSTPHEAVFKVNNEVLKKLQHGQQLNVNVLLIANSLKVSLTVSDWTVDDQKLDFSTEFNGLLNPASARSVKLTADKGAVAVATDNDGTQREATFSFKMFSPVGVRWTAHLENTSEFELTGTTSGYGAKDDAVDVTFGVKPKFEHVATDAKSVKLYITVEQPFGGAGSDGIQVINPKENGVYRFPGTSTEILIQQVSESEFDGLTESVSIKQ